MPIIFTSGAKEIVIDYTALITFHRLVLIPKLADIFDAIYYPDILNAVWEEDRQKYKPVQASQERIYEELKDKFERDLINCISLSGLYKGSEPELAVALSEKEGIPLVSAYLEKELVDGKPSVVVIRFNQILTHLYEKGRINESRYLELKRLSSDRESLITNGTDEIFKKADRLVFDSTTLERIKSS